MIKNILTHILLVGFIFSGYVKAQNADSVITSAGTMDVYYDLATGNQTSVDRSMWDIGLSTSMRSSSIIINENAGIELFVYSKDTSEWNSVDTTGFNFDNIYNSEESFIKVHDFNGCNDSLQSNIITDLGIYIQVNLNTNTVTFEYFADEDYIERVEGIYRDTLSRVESTADALWSELGCN